MPCPYGCREGEWRGEGMPRPGRSPLSRSAPRLVVRLISGRGEAIGCLNLSPSVIGAPNASPPRDWPQCPPPHPPARATPAPAAHRTPALARGVRGCGATEPLKAMPKGPLPWSRFFRALRESGKGRGGIRRQGAALPPLASLDDLPSPGTTMFASWPRSSAGGGAGVGAQEGCQEPCQAEERGLQANKRRSHLTVAPSAVRWGGVEPPRLAAHGPQPCLSASSSTSARRPCNVEYYSGRTRSVNGDAPGCGWTL